MDALRPTALAPALVPALADPLAAPGDPRLRGTAPTPALVLMPAISLAATAVPVLAGIDAAHHDRAARAGPEAVLSWRALLHATALAVSAKPAGSHVGARLGGLGHCAGRCCGPSTAGPRTRPTGPTSPRRSRTTRRNGRVEGKRSFQLWNRSSF